MASVTPLCLLTTTSVLPVDPSTPLHGSFIGLVQEYGAIKHRLNLTDSVDLHR